MQQPNEANSKRDEVREVVRLSKYLNQCCTLACTACEHGFQSYSAFKTHMRTKHFIRSAIDVEFTNAMLRANRLATLVPQAPADDSKSLCLPLNNIPKSFDGTVQLPPLQDVYWRAPQSLSSGNRVLTEILELALFTGTQCAHDKCSYCCKSKSGMRTHFQSTPSHRSSGFKNHAVYIQRLGESRNSKWFPVVFSNPSRTKASETTLRRSPEVPQAARCQADITKPAPFYCCCHRTPKRNQQTSSCRKRDGVGSNFDSVCDATDEIGCPREKDYRSPQFQSYREQEKWTWW